MNPFTKTLTLGVTLACAGSIAYSADCGITAGRVSIVGNEFPAIHTVANAATACDNITGEANLTADHQKINLAGMQGNPAEYTSAIIANSSLIALMNEDVVRPLNDLVAKHAPNLPKNRLITINGNIMAVAFMANAQTLAYRADVLDKIGADVPKSYEDMLTAAQKIRDAGIMANPIGGAYKAGWNLAEEFVNMYIGFGGDFYKQGSAEVAINNEKGIATLNMLKALSEYMNPDYLTHDSNATGAEVEAGNVALMSMWGSRMGNLMDDEGAAPEVYNNLRVGPPLTVGGGNEPASTLWWDGWTVAKNISDADAEATFLAMLHATSPNILNDETMGQAVWMIDGYKPAAVNDGVFAAIAANTKPYPMLPYQGLLHTALGDNIADFLKGDETAGQTLADTEAAYTAAAKEKGFLN